MRTESHRIYLFYVQAIFPQNNNSKIDGREKEHQQPKTADCIYLYAWFRLKTIVHFTSQHSHFPHGEPDLKLFFLFSFLLSNPFFLFSFLILHQISINSEEWSMIPACPCLMYSLAGVILKGLTLRKCVFDVCVYFVLCLRSNWFLLIDLTKDVYMRRVVKYAFAHDLILTVLV